MNEFRKDDIVMVELEMIPRVSPHPSRVVMICKVRENPASCTRSVLVELVKVSPPNYAPGRHVGDLRLLPKEWLTGPYRSTENAWRIAAMETL